MATQFPNVDTFQDLIAWIATTWHKGKIYPIAKRCHINHALMDHWSKGLVLEPKLPTVLRLCDAYELDPIDVLNLLVAPRDLRKGPEPLATPLPARAMRTGAKRRR
jgi:hypothetical protein